MFVEDLFVNSVLRLREGEFQALRITGDGLTIEQGGLVIDLDGATIHDGGLAINDDGALIQTNGNEHALHVVSRATSGYTSTVLQVSSEQPRGDTFRLAELDTDGDVVFTVSGNGQVRSEHGGVWIDEVGLHVESGGGTIVDGGLFVQNREPNDPVLHVSMDDPDFNSVGINITSDELASFSNYFFFQAVNTDG